MTLDQLRYFVAAAKYEHMGRAARSIPISISVVSQSVKQLEQEFACELFVREQKRVRLTARGGQLLNIATDLLERASGVGQALGQPPLELEGHFRTGASAYLATQVVTPVVTRLQNKFARLSADVLSQPTWAVVDSLLAGRIDFGFGFSPAPHPQLIFEEIYRGQSVIVVRKNHPVFKRAAKNHYKHLGQYPSTLHIAADRIIGARSHPVLKALGLDTPVTFGYDNDFTALENLKAGHNWCLMIDIVAKSFSKDLRIIPIPRQDEVTYGIYFMRHKSRKMDGTMTELLAGVKEYIK